MSNVELIPMSHLTRGEQSIVDRTAAAWGDPVKILIAIEDLAEQLGISRNDAAQLVLAYNRRPKPQHHHG